MYMYGGFALECNSECGDFWRYEIPWAAQRYYPEPGNDLYWNRGNYWENISTPYSPGPRKNHQMTVSPDMQYIYLFGGISNSVLLNDLWRYSLANNVWEKLNTQGAESAWRNLMLWNGTEITINVPLDQFTINDNFTYSTAGVLPPPRLGHSLIYFQNKADDLLILYGGYGVRMTPLPDGYNIPESKSDMWTFSIAMGRWTLVEPRGTAPPPRYSTSLFVYGSQYFILFSGSSLEQFWSDIWQYNVQANAFNNTEGLFTLPGVLNPSAREGHTFVYTAAAILLYGGTIGTTPNITASDADYQSLQIFESQCGPFLLRYNLSVTDLGQPNFLAQQQALYNETNNTCFLWNKTFPPPVGTIDYDAGMWIFNVSTCLSNCSGNGLCLGSSCICNPGFYGLICDQQECPNSVCVMNTDFPDAKYCFHCSGKGTCVSGLCVCNPGFIGNDCSIQDCPNNCSHSGTCVKDYPYARCICPGNDIGDDCSSLSCINDCNAPYGICNTTSGTCNCVNNYYGDDCSVYVLPSEATWLVDVTQMLLLVLWF